MAKKKKEKTPKTFSEAIGAHYIINDKTGFVLGIVLLCLALYVLVAFISYFSTGEADQSLVTALRPGEIENSTKVFQNSCGSVGALLSYFLIARCFGIPAFIIPLYIILCGVRMIKAYEKINLWKWFFGMALIMVWSSITFAKFLTPLMGDNIFNPGGDHGAFVVEYVENIIGSPGLIAILAITMIAFLTYLTSETITVIKKLLNPVGYLRDKVKFTIVQHNIEKDKIGESTQEMETAAVEKLQNIEAQTVEFLDDDVPNVVIKPNAKDKKNTKEDDSKPTDNSEIGIEVDMPEAVEKAQGKVVAGATDLTSPINPHEPFINWKYPTLNLLKQYDSDNNVNFVDKEELEANKNRIIKVLNDFGVQIRSIRATVGPTITLYEITPAQGVRISKIKNLEDDIALSLAAIGIRIIAPMPGKGTIGIEVPNAKPSIVSMFSILNSRKFQESTMELPIALGKTITNDVYMVDLAKIPHLLVAGATGQGKSVGLNAIITSLLYKKHPNDLKIVLVDPKKVEFSIYAPIAKPFMAAVEENEDEPIITDVQKVVKTLKGLCVLMDNRYDM